MKRTEGEEDSYHLVRLAVLLLPPSEFEVVSLKGERNRERYT